MIFVEVGWPPPADSDFGAQVREVLTNIGDMLVAKNQLYGNSALDPVRVFSQASAVEQLKVRIDDKLSRLVRGHVLPEAGKHSAGEDVVDDLIGYLVLLKIAETNNAT